MDVQKWHSLSTIEQLSNIGAEIGRAINWRKMSALGNPEDSFNRALEYLSLTIDDPKLSYHRRREVCRTRETLVDWYHNFGTYQINDNDWTNYFNQFGIAVNIQKQASQGK